MSDDDRRPRSRSGGRLRDDDPPPRGRDDRDYGRDERRRSRSPVDRDRRDGSRDDRRSDRRRSPSPRDRRRRSPSPYDRRRRSPSPYDRRRRSPSPYDRRRRSPVRGGRSPPRQTSPPRAGCQLFVAGFNFIANERDVTHKFGKYGRVKDVRIVRGNMGESKGFGFVDMETPEDAKEVIRNMNQVEWNGRKLLVEIAKRPR